MGMEPDPAVTSQAAFHIADSVETGIARRLEAQLVRAGAALSAAGTVGGISLVSLRRLDEVPEGQPVVALYDGLLSEAILPALQRWPPALLWASREGGEHSEWEGAALVALVAGKPLLASMGPLLLRARVSSFGDIQVAARAAVEQARSAGASPAGAAAAGDAMYELVANALLVAPVGQDGVPRYAHQRDAHPRIAPEDACEITIGIAGGRMLLSALDRFGRLGLDPFLRTIPGLSQRAKVDRSGGGAGLGIRRMIEHSDLILVRVQPNRATQVLCAVDMRPARRRSSGLKSFFFWSERG